LPTSNPQDSAAQRADYIRQQLPESGLFAGHEWRISPTPFPLGARLAKDLDKLGRVLLQFYRATNLLYRKSAEGKLPEWVANLLDQGKPSSLISLQRHEAFKHDVPRVIRPDILLTEDGFSITELDSVPGGIGLTGWLNQTYQNSNSEFDESEAMDSDSKRPAKGAVIGGGTGPVAGFSGIFDDAKRVQVIVSDESVTYRPEMEWLANKISPDRDISVRNSSFEDFQKDDAVYRFFELFDLPNVANAEVLFQRASEQSLRLSPPPKAFLEEKLIFSLLWNRNLREFWRQELGQGFLKTLLNHIPYSWTIDPTPLPPHAAYPELGLTDWQQLKTLSQKERRLILKISGFAPEAWGARGVHLGSDLSTDDWGTVVDKAIKVFDSNPHILQRFTKPRVVDSHYFDFESRKLIPMSGRVRLCPYYFVQGNGDQARAKLGGCLATICPSDKKIIHGMSEAIMAPCSIE
jgi:hypothetical protein